MVQINLPNPGSDEAIDQGCACPVLDNGHGRGPGPFWINVYCPLHGAPPPQTTGRTMTVGEKKPRQNTGNHPDPLSEYPEARKRMESCADYPNARRPDGVLVSTVRCDDLRTLLAGPPEPSEEEVLAAWFDVEPDRMKGPKHRSEVASVQRVQALYRSRRA